MRKVAILVIALVLAPGLQSATITTFPHLIIPETRPENIPEVGILPHPVPEVEALPLPIPELEALPLPIPEIEVLPHPIPEVEAVLPELVTVNPCDACFEYMSSLIEQLTAVPETPVHPELPELEVEEPEVIRPLPESVPEDLRPLPVPEQPEIGVNPIPMPVVPEIDLRPLPLPIQPETEVNPMPLPIAPELIVSSEALPDEY
ncbi:hypothetical protein NQ315_016615 [Exocentrus adspersus]|uniref:Uncharacterized protein n=1 Tax=Exocentrus adspersus TaxID=1586481 RepID=A0AAV8VPJ8_9CUCU|nr:hypothetical protein NQ315_016615 [Exocentrus adspersus]